jgi:hypothetical protein
MSDPSLEDLLTALLIHNCTTCLWMQPNKGPPKKGQKFCKYPGAIEASNNQCMMWEVELDPKKRYAGSWVV